MDATDERIVAFIKRHPRLPIPHVAAHCGVSWDTVQLIVRALPKDPPRARRACPDCESDRIRREECRGGSYFCEECGLDFNERDPDPEEARLTLRTIRASERLLKRRETSGPKGASGNGNIRAYSVRFSTMGQFVYRSE